MNKTVQYFLNSAEQKFSLWKLIDLVVFCKETMPDIYARIKQETTGIPRLKPLFQYYIRTRKSIDNERTRTLIDLKKPIDKYEIISAPVFSGEIIFDQETKKHIPVFYERKITRKMHEFYQLRENARIKRALEQAGTILYQNMLLLSQKEELLKQNIKYLQGQINSLKRQSVLDLYFMRDTHTGEVKIGISRDPEQRRKTIQVERGHDIRIIGIVPGEGRKLEQELHRQFAETRTNGEWFTPSAELMEYIVTQTA